MASRFQRFLLPGFAFKAVVIGGGYATGRELAEYFLPSGPHGAIAGMLLAMVLWSLICAATFLFARRFRAFDYVSFVQALLGRAWIAFELAYLMFVILILAVFGAAAGALGEAVVGVPRFFGTLALMIAIALVVAFGNTSVERLFKYVSFLLYGVYIAFAVLAFAHFGDRIAAGLHSSVPPVGWVWGGVTYAAYNVVGAIAILPVLRHLQSDSDAIVAGVIAGPLAMLPALIFLLCMLAYYPQIASQALPSDFLLQRLSMPVFHLVFQIMIFAALLESGSGAIHAVNERIAQTWRTRHSKNLDARIRLGLSLGMLIVCMLLAQRFGLVALIARGYRMLALVFLLVYVVPLLTVGISRLLRTHSVQEEYP
jgi:uncharacterized membrane protein YkvI